MSEELRRQRDAARLVRDWPLADALRKQLNALGFDVRDKKDGTSRLIYRPHKFLKFVDGRWQ
jgi:cysteinyl-tRNA synthetase